MASQTTVAPTVNASEPMYIEASSGVIGMKIFFLVYMFLVAIATIVTNGLTLYAIYKDPLKCFRNPLTIFITGVVAADFLFGLFGEATMASGMAHLLHTGNIDGFLVSVLGMAVSSITISISFLTLLALAISQLLATGWLNRYERCVSPKSARIGIVTIWVVTFVIYVAFAATVSPFLLLGLTILVVTLVTIALVVLYIVTYRVFRSRIGQQEPSLENDLVSQEFLKATFLLVLVQIITIWPYIVTTMILTSVQTSHYFSVLVEVILLITSVFFLAKFLIDPIILVWRIPKYRKSMKIVYASCLARFACCRGDTGGERGASYNKAPKDDVDEHSQDNAQVEVI